MSESVAFVAGIVIGVDVNDLAERGRRDTSTNDLWCRALDVLEGAMLRLKGVSRCEGPLFNGVLVAVFEDDLNVARCQAKVDRVARRVFKIPEPT